MRAGIRSRPWAGLDIGTYSVKLLTSTPVVGGARHALAEQPLPPLDGDPERGHAPEVVARAVSDCLTQVGLSPRGLRGVTLGIAGPDVILKQITLPLLDDAEVGPALRFEARKHLPFDLQGMLLDYQVLARLPSEKRLSVLLAAVSQERLQRQCAPLKMLGLEADIVDAVPLALTNAIGHGAEKDRDPLVLIDIGHTASHLTMWQKGEPYFMRRLDFGGRTLTRAIGSGAGMEPEEAEEWKLAAGADEPGFRVDWDSIEMRAVLECLRVELAEELRRSFAFYRTMGRLPDPLRLWVSGGSARLPGLAARLSELLDVPVLLFDPLELVGAEARGARMAGPQFATAYGLALRSA
jgi:type IV pilus assembly protein PilM